MLIMKLNLQQSRLWKMPVVIFNILRHVFVQDPLPILSNAKVYFYEDKEDLVSYCTFTEYREYQQLRDVFTFHAYRLRGNATSLIKEVLLHKKKPTFLICKTGISSFYRKIGFQETKILPFCVFLRFKTGNFLSHLFFEGLLFCNGF
jgi:hypothetical protein